jgi:hypothetical protein
MHSIGFGQKSANARVHTRIAADMRDRASEVLDRMGLTISGAVRILPTRTANDAPGPSPSPAIRRRTTYGSERGSLNGRKSARSDRRRICGYIDAHNPRAATAMDERIREALGCLLHLPMRAASTA